MSPWIHEVLMQVGNVLGNASFAGPCNKRVVDHDQMIDVLTEANASSMWAAANVELGSHQHDGKNLIDRSKAAGVILAEIKSTGSEELLEDDSILACFAATDQACAQRWK